MSRTDFFKGLAEAFNLANGAVESIQGAYAQGAGVNIQASLVVVSESKKLLEEAIRKTETLLTNVRGGECAMPPKSKQHCEKVRERGADSGWRRIVSDIEQYGFEVLLEHFKEMLDMLLMCSDSIENELKRLQSDNSHAFQLAPYFEIAQAQLQRCFKISMEFGSFPPGSEQKAT